VPLFYDIRQDLSEQVDKLAMKKLKVELQKLTQPLARALSFQGAPSMQAGGLNSLLAITTQRASLQATLPHTRGWEHLRVNVLVKASFVRCYEGAGLIFQGVS